MGHPEPLNLGKLISLETALWQSVVGSSGSDAGSLSPLSLVLCPPTPRKAPATPAPLTLAHLITSPWSIGFYSSPDPQVLGGPAPMTASRGSPYFQPPPKLDYLLLPILFQSIQLESSFPSDRWLCIVCKNISLIKPWIFKSQIPSTSTLLSEIPRPIVGLKSSKLCTQLNK